MTAQDVIRLLGLQPLEFEGGYYRETHRTRLNVLDRCGTTKPASTAIYYLLTSETRSRLHRLAQDEVWHFYLGDPVLMLLLGSDARLLTLGPGIERGQQPQLVVPAGIWQGALVREGGSWALLGTTAAPGFDRDDFEPASRDSLLAAFPEYTTLISRLT